MSANWIIRIDDAITDRAWAEAHRLISRGFTVRQAVAKIKSDLLATGTDHYDAQDFADRLFEVLSDV